MRGPDFIRGFVDGGGVSDRRLRDRIRKLVKEGRLVEFKAAGERSSAKSYSLPEDQDEEFAE